MQVQISHFSFLKGGRSSNTGHVFLQDNKTPSPTAAARAASNRTGHPPAFKRFAYGWFIVTRIRIAANIKFILNARRYYKWVT